MNSALDETTSQEREGIASVDGKGCILRFDPFSFASVVVSDLQGSNGLTEKKSPCAEISVATSPESTKLQVFLGGVFSILHVTQVILIIQRFRQRVQ